MVRRILAILAAVLLSGCATVPITHLAIEGTYSLRGADDGHWYAGQSVVLRDGSFEYSIFTDALDDPRLTQFPVRGRYTLEGASITLHHPAVPSQHMILTRRSGRFVLWTPEQHDEYLRTRRTPKDVLYQHR